MHQSLSKQLKKIKVPEKSSHKGQNGKLLIIGGSDLFHAASKWSLDIGSKFVDMVFYASVPSNNELIQEAKGEFWNGIVIKREDIENYIQEADCILIGPGMTRTQQDQWVTGSLGRNSPIMKSTDLSEDDWNSDTQKIVNYLLSKYPEKRWVIDAGALQMVDPELLNQNCIITPHKKEFEDVTHKLSEVVLRTQFKKHEGTTEVFVNPEQKQHIEYDYVKKSVYGTVHLSEKGSKENFLLGSWSDPTRSYSTYQEVTMPHQMSIFHDLNWDLYTIALAMNNATLVLKGELDLVISPGNECIIFSGDEKFMDCIIPIEGGNAGMTKGGTGDVLAGLIAALYCTHDAVTAAVVGSYINKKAGDSLYKKVGPYFNASDLVEEIPKIIWEEINSVT